MGLWDHETVPDTEKKAKEEACVPKGESETALQHTVYFARSVLIEIPHLPALRSHTERIVAVYQVHMCHELFFT